MTQGHVHLYIGSEVSWLLLLLASQPASGGYRGHSHRSAVSPGDSPHACQASGDCHCHPHHSLIGSLSTSPCFCPASGGNHGCPHSLPAYGSCSWPSSLTWLSCSHSPVCLPHTSLEGVVLLLSGALLLASGLLSLLITWIDMPGLLGAWITGGELYSHGLQTGPRSLILTHQGRQIVCVREQLLPLFLVTHLPIGTRGPLLLIGVVRMIWMVMSDHPHLSRSLLRISRGWSSNLYGGVVVRRLYVIWGSPFRLEIGGSPFCLRDSSSRHLRLSHSSSPQTWTLSSSDHRQLSSFSVSAHGEGKAVEL